MITIKNLSTGELHKVWNVDFVDGVIRSNTGKELGTRFVCNNAQYITECWDANHAQYFTLNEGWEPATTAKRERKPRTTTTTTETETTTTTEPQPKPEPTTEGGTRSDAELLIELIRRNGGAGRSVDIDEVRSIVRSELAAAEPRTHEKEVAVIRIDGTQTGKVESPHPMLEKLIARVVNDRVIGRYPWLFGPAGSGKSSIAKQVADALSLPFYGVSAIQQKYELEGYTDASGRLVETSFYKAFRYGGIFLFDEARLTTSEVFGAFNTGLANLRYNFPGVGMIDAHPDFHPIAADNTKGRGSADGYVGFELDPSTLDRFNFIELNYLPELELSMASNDTDLVEFLRDVRRTLKEFGLIKYLATPRAAKAIKALEQLGTKADALFEGLCSGWDAQDVRTIAAAVNGSTEWHKEFKKIAKTI